MLRYFRARAAFERTQPHPADARVRITQSPDDIVAIHDKRAAAIIWERAAPNGAIEAMRAQPVPGYYAGWILQKSVRFGFGATVAVEGGWPNYIPPILGRDIEFIHALFAAHCRTRHLPHRATYRMLNEGGDRGGEPFHHRAESYGIHWDGSGGVRIVTTYTEHHDQTTEWYPGLHSQDSISKLNDDFQKARDPDAVKDAAGRQWVGAFNVLCLKKGVKHRPPEQRLLHASPVARPGKSRIALIAG